MLIIQYDNISYGFKTTIMTFVLQIVHVFMIYLSTPYTCFICSDATIEK